MKKETTLIIVRHAESEQNVIVGKIKKDTSYVPSEKFLNTPDREFRLSTLGRTQAKFCAKTLLELYPDGVDVVMASDHIRAKETAGIVLKENSWNNDVIVDPKIGERSWGITGTLSGEERVQLKKKMKEDPLHTPMIGGETLLYSRIRARILLESVLIHYEGKTVLVFSHGEYILSLWAEIFSMDTKTQLEFFDEHKVRNCHIVEFKSDESEFKEYRQTVPTKDAKKNVYHPWTKVTKKKLKSNDLLKEVDEYPSIIDD